MLGPPVPEGAPGERSGPLAQTGRGATLGLLAMAVMALGLGAVSLFFSILPPPRAAAALRARRITRAGRPRRRGR